MRALAILLLLTGAVNAQQLELSSESGFTAKVEGGIKFFSDDVFIPGTEAFTPIPAELIRVDTTSTRVNVRMIAPVTLERITIAPIGQQGASRYYLWTRPGLWLVDVIDFDIGAVESITIEIGSTPNPPDPPGVPPDKFDNLGRRVYGWTREATVNAAMAKVYASNSVAYRGSLTLAIDQMNQLNKEVAAIPGYKSSEYTVFVDGVNADLKPRFGDMLRDDLADWWLAISKGLL